MKRLLVALCFICARALAAHAEDKGKEKKDAYGIRTFHRINATAENGGGVLTFRTNTRRSIHIHQLIRLQQRVRVLLPRGELRGCAGGITRAARARTLLRGPAVLGEPTSCHIWP